jgi:hypothetical protein
MTSEPSKRPWWVSGQTLKGTRLAAILYSIVFVIYGAVILGFGGGGNAWTVVLFILWGVLTLWGWLSFSYFFRESRRE